MGHAFQTVGKPPSRSPGCNLMHAPLLMRRPGSAIRPKSTLKIGAPDDAYEREANAVADRIDAGFTSRPD